MLLPPPVPAVLSTMVVNLKFQALPRPRAAAFRSRFGGGVPRNG